MMNVLAFNGSPRRKGNTSHLLESFMRGAREAGAQAEEIIADDVNLDYCSGCLRCNMIKRCANRRDQWPDLSRKILAADTLVIASPVYFHHVTASMKKILDRFRCFMKVRITETGLEHTAWQEWKKQWVLLLSLGSSSTQDTEPIVDLFKFMTGVLGEGNELHTLIGTRLAVVNQVTMEETELVKLYDKMGVPGHFAADDSRRNRELLDQCYYLGKQLSSCNNLRP